MATFSAALEAPPEGRDFIAPFTRPYLQVRSRRSESVGNRLKMESYSVRNFLVIEKIGNVKAAVGMNPTELVEFFCLLFMITKNVAKHFILSVDFHWHPVQVI